MHLFHHARISHRCWKDLKLYLWVASWFCHMICRYIRIFLNEFSPKMIRLLSFLGFKVFDFFHYNGLCYFLETKIMLLYLVHMIFDGRNTRMMFVSSMIDAKEFVSDVVTSFALYASMPRFGTMLTKNSLKDSSKCFFWCNNSRFFA